MKKAIALSLLAGAIAAVSPAQSIMIKTTTILDGKGGVLRNKEIVIEGSKISRVADARGSATYDLSGLTVMPGWIDTHVHPGWYFNRENRLEQGGRGSIETAAASALYAEANVYATLMGGFTTVQSVGQEIDKDLRDLINRGVLPGPRIITSLRAVTENTGDPAKIRAYVDKMKADGADVI
jgi:imidazolonepropionase-like amidohydrolase